MCGPGLLYSDVLEPFKDPEREKTYHICSHLLNFRNIFRAQTARRARLTKSALTASEYLISTTLPGDKYRQMLKKKKKRTCNLSEPFISNEGTFPFKLAWDFG